MTWSLRAYPAHIAPLVRAPFTLRKGLVILPLSSDERGASATSGVCRGRRGEIRQSSQGMPGRIPALGHVILNGACCHVILNGAERSEESHTASAGRLCEIPRCARNDSLALGMTARRDRNDSARDWKTACRSHNFATRYHQGRFANRPYGCSRLPPSAGRPVGLVDL